MTTLGFSFTRPRFVPAGFTLPCIVAAVSLLGLSSFAQARSLSVTNSRTDIEINGMTPDLDCSQLDLDYSKSYGEIYLKFNEPFKHVSGEGYKKHCLVDFELYVPENYRFVPTDSAVLGYVETDDSTFARVATSYRPIGKAGAVSTRKFGPGAERNFYVRTGEPSSSLAMAEAANMRGSKAGSCDGYSMKLRLRVDLSLADDQPALKQSLLQIYSATMRYRMQRCRR